MNLGHPSASEAPGPVTHAPAGKERAASGRPEDRTFHGERSPPGGSVP
jgi:hypothetical protein